MIWGFAVIKTKTIITFEMTVLFEPGELNTYVHDSRGFYRRTFVTDGGGRRATITPADRKLLPCIAAWVELRHTSGSHDIPPCRLIGLQQNSGSVL